MTDITPETFPKYTVHPVLQGLSDDLKDPKNYKKIQKIIIESLASSHSHGEVMEWAACPECQKRFAERGDVIKRLGFKSTAQYMAWKKIHEAIKERVPYPKYNSK